MFDMKIELLRQTIETADCEVLRDFTSFDPEEWSIVKGPLSWKVTGETILGGAPDAPTHGQLFCKTPVTGDVILEFDARIVPPSYHDIVWFWNTTFCADDEVRWAGGYLGCMAGWWNNLTGIERLPFYDPNAVAACHATEPGRWYHIVSGSSKDEHFINIDGKTVFLMTDSKPADVTHPNYFGFGVYESMCEYRALKVFKAVATPRRPVYAPGVGK